MGLIAGLERERRPTRSWRPVRLPFLGSGAYSACLSVERQLELLRRIFPPVIVASVGLVLYLGYVLR